jgi:glycosidase/fibronectin type 3 domain-containing protein
MLPNQNIVNAWDDTLANFTAVGDWQGWDNANPATAMTEIGQGIFYLKYAVSTAGTYQAKIVQTGSWSEQFAADGRSVDGPSIPFTTVSDNEDVVFLLDTKSGRVTVTPNGNGAGNWCLAGGINGWDNASDPLNDDGLNGDLIGGDGLFAIDYAVANAGRDEWKIVECGNWGVAYPSDNAWVLTGVVSQTVKFTFDTNDHSGDVGLPLLPVTNIVNAWDDVPANFTAVGDWQGWDPGNPASAMTNLGDNYFLLNYAIPSAGSYQVKMTETGGWDNQVGSDGRNKNAPTAAFDVFADNDIVQFWLDGNQGRIAVIAPPEGGAGHDDNIWWDYLGHNSRDGLYRTPGGPVTNGTPVTVRMRAANNDLTGAKVRVWNDRLDVQQILDMTRVANDGTYEWWEATVPASLDSTIFWYRFIAIDGTATAYYEDDESRDGGWGQTFGESQDYSWQLTVYDPTFHTPDWVKNAVIYQIFPDRFRDGDPTNDTPAGTFFYDEPGGTIYRSNQSDWNQYICDPRDAADCPGTYSKNFYGGDLQGIVDNLDYLQGLGVTALYLNPVFDSPSNHKYDTTDFGIIDDAFGDLTMFQTLVTEAHNRGINVIVDGVFNHTSSDSIYFDRYGRYPAPDGACESATSPYREWYFFQDVPAGSGACVGSDGTPNAATYDSWFGFDSLPKLDSTNQEVRDLIWDGGPDSIARYWLQWADGWRLDVGGDIDPGLTNDPDNDYWEGFRDAIHQTNPDAYMVLEEWGNASPWLLGQEMDATMNYQYSSAIMSFWRDETFIDNDHNPGSSAGPLVPLSPSELDNRLHNWIERYPPEAMYAMMNLLGSHDTNRPLFMLDHNTDLNDESIYEDPNYDWSDSIARLQGVILLQMTLPGAPTVYYGDEVGLVGPVTYDGATWQDDPYNRQPFPWLDESGTPFYTHLQSQGTQDALRDKYSTLAAARNNHPALRTGSFDTLLVDDDNSLYVYGRKTADNSDVAVVLLNRAGTMVAPLTQTVTVDVAGYLPVGATFDEVLTGDSYTVDSNGEITLDVPGQSGSVLVLSAPIAAPPDAVADLAVTAERSEELDLAWTAAAGADSYDIYRSLVSGGGYGFLANTAASTYTDTGLENSVAYYYVVVSRDDTNLLTSGASNEAMGIPHHDLSSAWYNLQWPPEITHTISTLTPTENIYGQLWIDGATGGAGPATGIMAQVGYGIFGTLPTDPGWMWVNMNYNGAAGNNDEYYGNLLPDMLGDFSYVTRWSSDGGQTWYYSDLSGPGTNGNPGAMHVIPGSDTTAPSAPANLTVDGSTAGSITISWDANGEPDLAGYEIYRQEVVTESLSFVRIAIVVSSTTSYIDESVVTGGTYDYYVLAFDTSFNRSDPSNIVQATAEPRFVEVTFNAVVPAFTPGTVYIVGSLPQVGSWNPGAVPMAQVDATTWSITQTILDQTQMEYKFTRGNWETVEKEADGNTEIANRTLTIDYGIDGTQVLTLTVANWRDPVVAGHAPASGATEVPTGTLVTVTWSQEMPPETDFDVTGPDGVVSGTFGYDGVSNTSVFTPDMPLAANATYTVTVVGKPDIVGDVQQVPLLWTFQTFARMVGLTIEVTVPDFTPGIVYVFGNQPELGDWDPGAVSMTQSGPVTWTITLDFLENTPLAFNFGRGSEETEETESDGNTSVPTREVTVTYGPGGTQSESYSAANWRDPIIVDHFPADGASNQPIDTTISVSWSQAMGVGTDFLVVGPDGPISGTFTYYANTYTYVFTPSTLLAVGATYTVTAAGQTDAGGDSQQVPAQFNFDTMVPTSVELVTLAEKPTITDSWWWVSWPWLMVLLTAVSLIGVVWIKRRRTVDNR